MLKLLKELFGGGDDRISDREIVDLLAKRVQAMEWDRSAHKVAYLQQLFGRRWAEVAEVLHLREVEG